MSGQEICLRNVERVTLMNCDDGLKMVFTPEEGAAVSVTLSWLTAAHMTIRLDKLGQDAFLMMQAGLNPYLQSHRVSFLTAELQIACEAAQPKEPGA